MKLLKILTLIMPALADKQFMKEWLNSKVGSISGQSIPRALMGMDYDDSYIDTSRLALARSRRAADLASTLSAIDGYGCWCYFGDDEGQAKGEPVDDIDIKCQTLRKGYQCATLDATINEEDDECIPWEVEYNPWLGVSTDNLYEDCLSENADNPCGARSCAVELWFLNEVMVDIATGAVNPDYQHANEFNTTTCIPEPTTTTTTTTTAAPVTLVVNVIKYVNKVVVVSGAEDPTTTEAMATTGEPYPEELCCGNYPERFKYETWGGEDSGTEYGDRQCCGSVTFDSTIHECCNEEESETRDFGTC